MNREILERPFETHTIKTRCGPSGRTFSYVEGTDYIRRLNEAFDGHWSFEIVEHHIHERDVIVVGKLIAEGCTKFSFGGSSITMSSSTGSPINLADDFKAAATDSLKKAASLFGLGLHLHSKSESPVDEVASSAPSTSAKNSRRTAPNKERSAEPAKKQQGAPKSTDRAAPSQNSSGGRPTLTDRQLNAIMAIGRTLGWTAEALRKRSMEVFGVPPNELSKSDASTFIGELQQMATSNAA